MCTVASNNGLQWERLSSFSNIDKNKKISHLEKYFLKRNVDDFISDLVFVG
jgi:hypothetical protein